MSAKHTPTPWSAKPAPCGYIYAICNEANDAIRVETNNPANADFIVLACNAHDELVSALQKLMRAGGKQGFRDGYEAEMDAADAALAKAQA